MSSTNTDRRASGELFSPSSSHFLRSYSTTIQDVPIQDVLPPYSSAPLSPPILVSSSTSYFSTSTYPTPNPSPSPSLAHLLNNGPLTLNPPHPTYQRSSSTSHIAASTYPAPSPSSSPSRANIFNSTPATTIVPPPPSAQHRRMSQFSILSPHHDEEAAQQRPSRRPFFRFPLMLLETLKRWYKALKKFMCMFSFLWDWGWWKKLIRVMLDLFSMLFAFIFVVVVFGLVVMLGAFILAVLFHWLTGEKMW